MLIDLFLFKMGPGGLPRRSVRKRAKVDTSKFMTPYLAHSQKMLDQYSHVRASKQMSLRFY